MVEMRKGINRLAVVEGWGVLAEWLHATRPICQLRAGCGDRSNKGSKQTCRRVSTVRSSFGRLPLRPSQTLSPLPLVFVRTLVLAFSAAFCPSPLYRHNTSRVGSLAGSSIYRRVSDFSSRLNRTAHKQQSRGHTFNPEASGPLGHTEHTAHGRGVRRAVRAVNDTACGQLRGISSPVA